MNVTPTTIPDVLLIEPAVFGDERGFFMETWQRQRFAEIGIDHDFVQDNYSRSAYGTLRGLHYQIQQPQGKLVWVTSGEVFDVAVDIRRHSATFGQWVGETLTADNKHMLWIPPGFAHGFCVTSDSADFQYKCTDYYAPAHERAIRWDDPALGIDWPLTGAPIVSDKDQRADTFHTAEHFS
ncbi:dTDP-4-dehydrorhamnose 3,5-epimerase [Spiribacter sp. SSL99]|uniref:dTDP-4-dehydrorhamnose 3,5-epimerase n=1 Tax=Spiribacter sp. SSL99 TaxID=1866884 RepID=UPI0013301D8B|nr:dTDP-4-dehydrorhamnose 3,5-epimerase [Spiribacter sp. SSL99]KAF0286431.1 dTDP-4-dehydrorhamnose 3,5-epimerase [Spiribacter sp. SSL99]